MIYYVCILRSTSHPNQTDVGFSADPKTRVRTHNEGGCPHTSKFKPWEIAWHCAFPDKHAALDFEKYLKSPSGKAFTSKRLMR